MLYSWIKNHFYFLWLYHDYNYEYIKFGSMSISFFIASIMSYPAYFCREMVDLWPKERGGHCTWNNNYRQAFRWQYQYMDQFYYNYMSGYTNWFKRYGAMYFATLWMADSFGMMCNCNEIHNDLQMIFPIHVETS
jgi:hypothetical protein